jgi:hypothetical protein
MAHTPRDAAKRVSPQQRITHEALVESFAASRVLQVLVAEIPPTAEEPTPTYQIKAKVTGRAGMRTLTGTRKLPRQFKNLDTVARVLREAAEGKPVSARLELLPTCPSEGDA